MTTIEFITLTMAVLTTLAGLIVAGQAYRGFRRNGSARMRALAVGVIFVAVIPAMIVGVVAVYGSVTDALALVGILFAHTVGLFVIYRSLD